MHVGRDVSCEIRIISPYVSRHHALIRRAEDSFVIEDERSTNGLQINGRVVREPHSLADGDCVAIGDVTLTYEEPDALTTAVFIAPVVLKQPVQAAPLKLRYPIAGRDLFAPPVSAQSCSQISSTIPGRSLS